MRKIKQLLQLGSLMVMASQCVAYSQDSGVIGKVYVSSIGGIAITLQGGFSNATAAQECPGNNGFAGMPAGSGADPLLKSAILAAKASGQNVTVTTEGCEAGGNWLKLTGIYLD